MDIALRASLLLVPCALLAGGCSSDPTTEEHAIVHDATPMPRLDTPTTARTELDRAAPSEFETATFALG